MLGYWFAKEDGRTEHLKHPAVVGKTDTFDGELIPCRAGLHASPTPFDALQYAPGPILFVVEIPDDAIPYGNPVDKYVAASRTYLFRLDVSKIMRQFAAQCALDVFDKWDPPDIVREYIEGTAKGEDKSSIRSSIRDAAWAAAGAACAMWAAATAAAWAATNDDAGSAMWNAAWAADTAWDAQKTNFNNMIADALEEAGWAAEGMKELSRVLGSIVCPRCGCLHDEEELCQQSTDNPHCA